ncbi:MAG: glycosyltransferase [Desulfovibrionaceae bacterium]
MADVYRILHIAPHFGGGIGSTLSTWLSSDTSAIHSVALLEYANEKAIALSREYSIFLIDNMHSKIEDLLQLMENADIVIIHFWNHPFLYNFLVRYRMPKSRIIIWSHISGIAYPNSIPQSILTYGNKCIFTTEASFHYIDAPKGPRYETILSIASLGRYNNTVPKKRASPFTIGYVGTVSYLKMHPDYINIHKRTSADSIIIVGGDSEHEIAQEADSRFIFTGKVDSVFTYLEKMDVFAYLLHPKHYGTSEHVLQEALSAGVVPVVLNNLSESYLIQHAITGFIANTIDEYIEYIALLKKDVHLYNMFSKNAKKYAQEYFSINTMITAWKRVFEKVMEEEKKEYIWNTQKRSYTSLEIFLESIGKYAPMFLQDGEVCSAKYSLHEEHKGFPGHYYRLLGGEELYNLIHSATGSK